MSRNKVSKSTKLGRDESPTPEVSRTLSGRADTQKSKIIQEKDNTELELEKLVFGDDEGFREGLDAYNAEGAFSTDDSEVENGALTVGEDDGDIQGLQDDDLFFIDASGISRGVQQHALVPVAASGEEESDIVDEEPAAWIDSDDERLTVSLASDTRLRKLRNTEEEDLVNGKEYMRRLRRQFERLHPAPEWANPAVQRASSHRKKRRRLSGSGSDSSSSDDGSDIDGTATALNQLSAQPLAALLQSASSLTQAPVSNSTTRKLRPSTIDVQRSKDVGLPQPSSITSLTFHPTSPLLLSSGPSGLLSIHHISPTSPDPNPLVTSLSIPSLPISTSTIHPSGTRIFLAARRRFFHIWDLPSGSITRVSRIYGHAGTQRSFEHFKLSPCGRYMGLVGSARKGGGVVNILDAHTTQWLAAVRVEGRGGVADFAWWRDGDGLVAIAKAGAAVEYSMLARRVVATWTDAGAVGTTVIALGGTLAPSAARANALGADRWLAVGSQSGVVNVYDRAAWRAADLPERPAPRRALDQLVTPVSHLLFSADGQMLVMASRWKRDALRLVHAASCTVYKNWPSSGAPLCRITSVALRSDGGLLAVGNEQGKIRLWDIRD